MNGEFVFLRISESVIYLLLPEEELMFFTEDKVGALVWDLLMALGGFRIVWEIL